MNPVETLIARAGAWRGSNTLHDPVTGQPEESPSTLVVTPVLGGRFVRLDSTWSHQGTPQEGSLLIGFDPKSGAVSGHWVDSWHMGRLVLACRGVGSPDGVIALRGSFAAPPGPEWGWRIDVAAVGEGLKVLHTCIDPDEAETVAAECLYQRA